MPLTHLTKLGSSIQAVFDDGTRVTCIPIGSGLWLPEKSSGGGSPGSGEFVQPFPYSAVSSEYGPRTGGAGSFHEGIDFGGGAVGGTGTPIKSIGDGTVSESYYHSNFGNMVIADHGTLTTGSLAGKQIKSLYAHLDTPGAAVGTALVAGQTVIGPLGNTGGSFGAHLHLEIHVMNPGGSIVHNLNDDGGFRTAMNPRDFFAEYGS